MLKVSPASISLNPCCVSEGCCGIEVRLQLAIQSDDNNFNNFNNFNNNNNIGKCCCAQNGFSLSGCCQIYQSGGLVTLGMDFQELLSSSYTGGSSGGCCSGCSGGGIEKEEKEEKEEKIEKIEIQKEKGEEECCEDDCCEDEVTKEEKEEGKERGCGSGCCGDKKENEESQKEEEDVREKESEDECYEEKEEECVDDCCKGEGTKNEEYSSNCADENEESQKEEEKEKECEDKCCEEKEETEVKKEEKERECTSSCCADNSKKENQKSQKEKECGDECCGEKEEEKCEDGDEQCKDDCCTKNEVEEKKEKDKCCNDKVSCGKAEIDSKEEKFIDGCEEENNDDCCEKESKDNKEVKESVCGSRCCGEKLYKTEEVHLLEIAAKQYVVEKREDDCCGKEKKESEEHCSKANDKKDNCCGEEGDEQVIENTEECEDEGECGAGCCSKMAERESVNKVEKTGCEDACWLKEDNVGQTTELINKRDCGGDGCCTEKEAIMSTKKEELQCKDRCCGEKEVPKLVAEECQSGCCGPKEQDWSDVCCDDDSEEEDRSLLDKGKKEENDSCVDDCCKGKEKKFKEKEKEKECKDECCTEDTDEDEAPLIRKSKKTNAKAKESSAINKKEESACNKGCCDNEEIKLKKDSEECGKTCCASEEKSNSKERDSCCASSDSVCISVAPTVPSVLVCCTVCWGGSCCKTDCCQGGCCVTIALSSATSLSSNPNASWIPSWLSFSRKGWNQLQEEESELSDTSNLGSLPASSTPASLASAFVQIGGMTCTDCATSIEKCLSKLPGVASSEVTYMTSKGRVSYNNQVVNEANIISQIQKLGFTAEAIQSDSETSFNINYASDAMPKYADGLLSAVLKMPGVLEARIDVKKRSLHVVHDFSALSPRAIAQCVKDAGWIASPVSSPSVSASANQLLWQWKWRFWVGTALSVPIVLIAYIFPLIHATKEFAEQDVAPGLSLGVLVSWVFSTPIQFWLAGHLYASAFKSLFFAHQANVDCLVMLSSSAAYIYSTLSVFVSLAKGEKTGESFFETCAILLTLIMLGRFIEVYAKEKTRKNLTHLVSAPRKCSVVNPDGTTSTEEVDWLGVGDIQQVTVGEQIAADGIVIFGSSEVDQSVLTGESVPIFKTFGDSVCSGSINLHGMLHIKVTKRAKDSTLTQIRKLVEDAQATSAPIQQITDKISSYFISSIIVLSLIVFIVWISVSSLSQALRFTISVLVVACPCALALSVPSAIMVGMEMGAKNGILYKEGGAVIEAMNSADIIIFDKTGTLTNGRPELIHYSIFTPILLSGKCKHGSSKCKECEEQIFFQLVGSAESVSEHPVAKAITKYSKEICNNELHTPNDFMATPGKGLTCEVEGSNLCLGNRNWMAENGITITTTIEGQLKTYEGQGETVICVALNRTLIGSISLKDTAKPEAKSIVESLKKQGKEVWMISGDNNATATAVGQQIGITNVMGDVLPASKAEKVKELQEQRSVKGKKRKVVMVGDGVNDAPALAQADVGIAIGAGTDIAIEAADCVLMNSSLQTLIVSFHLSHRIFSTIQRNIAWSFAYNLLFIFIASGAGHLFTSSSSFILEIPPSLAGASELLSSVPVLIHSSLLYYYSPHKV